MQILNQIQIKKLDDTGLMKYSQIVGANARKWKNYFVALIPEIAQRGLYKKKFASITEYAAKVGGISKKTVETIFQVEKYVEDKPALKELIPEVGINKVRVVATIATKENQKELAIKVKTMTKSALEEIARNERKTKTPPERSFEKEYFGFHVDKKNALEFRKFKLRLEKERKQKLDFNEVLGELLKITNKQEEKQKKTRQYHLVKKKVETRYISIAQKREIKTIHTGRCAFPSCNKPSTQNHHPDRFSLNKSHKRIVPLCDTHHELAHQGLIGNEDKPPNQWFIKKKPDRNHPKYKIDKKVIGYRTESFAIP